MRYLALGATLAICLGAVACKKAATSSSTAPTVTISIFPTATQKVLPGGTVNFSATVANNSNTGVNWEVNGNAGGDATDGTISTSGVYTAPPSTVVINPFDVTVTAQSQADTTKTSSTTVSIILPPPITISPTSAIVPAGMPQQFMATTKPANLAVIWEVNGQMGGSPVLGTVTQAGLYTAPQVPPASGTVTVQAVLQSNTSEVAAANPVTITYSNASLQNSYAFLLRGNDPSGVLLRAGTFTADGNGTITGGVEDINNGINRVQTAVALTGSYTINGDGRGKITFNDGFNGNTAGAGNSTFSVVVVSVRQVQMEELDTFASASGEADVQCPSALNANLQCPSPFASSSFQGEYTFDFSGADTSSKAISAIGQLFADGVGGTNQPAQEDVNDNGTLTSSTPSFSFQSVGANGHGLATLNGDNFSFYMVSKTQAKFISIGNPANAVAGTATLQTGAPFSTASIGGNFLLITNGSSSAGPVSAAASLSASNGALSFGVLTQNNAGNVSTLPSAGFASGTYTVASSGRGTASLSTGQAYVFYLSDVNSGVIQETDNSIVSDGSLTALSGGPFSTSNLAGGYALQLTGIGASSGEQDALGQISLLNGLTVTGAVDVNTAAGAGGLTAFTPASGVAIPGGSNYSIHNGTGSFNLTLSGTNLTFQAYFLSSGSLFLLRTDTNDTRVLHGNLYQDVSLSPAFVSANSFSFGVNVAGTFTVIATGNPAPTVTETGTLPSGLAFDPKTGVLSGTPAAGTGGTTTQNYPITFTATNGVGSPAVQNFTLTVVQCLNLVNGTCQN